MNDSKMFSINWTEVKSALVYGVAMAIITMLVQIKELGSIYNLDWKAIINSTVLALITTVLSLGKNFFTNSKGEFLGLIKVK